MAEKKIQSGNVEIWSEDFGDPTNPTVLLVMGANSGAVFWEPFVYEPILAAGYHVIRYDNRDFGLSTWVDYEKDPYTVVEMAGDAIAVLDAYGIDRAHLIGISMGGMISQQVALDYPDRVLSLTSIMSSPGGLDEPGLSPPTAAVQELIEALSADTKLDPTEAEADPIDAMLEMFRLLAGSRFGFDEPAYRALFQLEVDRGGFNPACAHGLAVENSPSRRKRLETLSTPTLVIHGDEDAILPLDHGEATADAIPGAKLVVLRGVNHELPEGCAEEYIGPLLDHLKANS